MPFRKLGGIFMEVVKPCDDLLAYLVESREDIDITGHNANSVKRDLAAGKLLGARFALMAFIFEICEYSVMGFPLCGGRGRGLLRFAKKWYE